MKPFWRWRAHKDDAVEEVDISEHDGVRSLHLGGSDTIQSSMRISAPHALELSYTRSMMGFLLFAPSPAHVLIIGLGGGSLAKFIHHHMMTTRVTAVEINPQVAAAARAYFALPDDDERLQVAIADGADFLAAHASSADVIMVDGFDGAEPAATLCTEAFYDNCLRALTADGVLVVNLWGSDRRFGQFVRRIGASFEGRILQLPAERRGNVIVLGFRDGLGRPALCELQRRAQALEAAYGLEFGRFVAALQARNQIAGGRLAF